MLAHCPACQRQDLGVGERLVVRVGNLAPITQTPPYGLVAPTGRECQRRATLEEEKNKGNPLTVEEDKTDSWSYKEGGGRGRTMAEGNIFVRAAIGSSWAL